MPPIDPIELRWAEREAAAEADLVAVYERARREILGWITSKIGMADTLTAQHRLKALAQIDDILKGTSKDAKTVMARHLRDSLLDGRTAAAEGVVDLTKRTRLLGTFSKLDPRQVEFHLTQSSNYIQAIEDELKHAIRRELAVGQAQGRHALSVAQSIAGETNLTLEGLRRPVFSSVIKRAQAIARTENADAANNAYAQTLVEAADAIPGLGKGWSATMDNRTSRRCGSLHDKYNGEHAGIPLDALFVSDADGWKGMRAPAHVHCRSRITAAFISAAHAGKIELPTIRPPIAGVALAATSLAAELAATGKVSPLSVASKVATVLLPPDSSLRLVTSGLSILSLMKHGAPALERVPFAAARIRPFTRGLARTSRIADMYTTARMTKDVASNQLRALEDFARNAYGSWADSFGRIEDAQHIVMTSTADAIRNSLSSPNSVFILADDVKDWKKRSAVKGPLYFSQPLDHVLELNDFEKLQLPQDTWTGTTTSPAGVALHKKPAVGAGEHTFIAHVDVSSPLKFADYKKKAKMIVEANFGPVPKSGVMTEAQRQFVRTELISQGYDHIVKSDGTFFILDPSKVKFELTDALKDQLNALATPLGIRNAVELVEDGAKIAKLPIEQRAAALEHLNRRRLNDMERLSGKEAPRAIDIFHEPLSDLEVPVVGQKVRRAPMTPMEIEERLIAIQEALDSVADEIEFYTAKSDPAALAHYQARFDKLMQDKKHYNAKLKAAIEGPPSLTAHTVKQMPIDDRVSPADKLYALQKEFDVVKKEQAAFLGSSEYQMTYTYDMSPPAKKKKMQAKYDEAMKKKAAYVSALSEVEKKIDELLPVVHAPIAQQGEQVIMYHGVTQAAFSGQPNIPFFVTADKGAALTYLRHTGASSLKSDDGLLLVTISPKNALTVSSASQYEKLQKAAGLPASGSAQYNKLTSYQITQAVAEHVKTLGYDAVEFPYELFKYASKAEALQLAKSVSHPQVILLNPSAIVEIKTNKGDVVFKATPKPSPALTKERVELRLQQLTEELENLDVELMLAKAHNESSTIASTKSKIVETKAKFAFYKQKYAEFDPKPAVVPPPSSTTLPVPKDPNNFWMLDSQHNATAFNPTWDTSGSKKSAFGSVLINEEGKVLLREPTNHFDGYHWTFAKGTQEPGHTILQTVYKEVAEETGYSMVPLATLDGAFETGNSKTFFFVSRAGAFDSSLMDKETKSTKWVTFEEAEALIKQTTNKAGRERDLQVLAAAKAKAVELNLSAPKSQSPAAPTAAIPHPRALTKEQAGVEYAKLFDMLEEFEDELEFARTHNEQQAVALYKNKIAKTKKDIEAIEKVLYAPDARALSRTVATEAEARKRLFTGQQHEYITYHATDKVAKNAILARGIDITAGRGDYGQGFYSSSMHNKFFGDERVKVAVKFNNPFVFNELHEWIAFVENVVGTGDEIGHLANTLSKRGAAYNRKKVLEAGYDGFIFPGTHPGEKWFVSLKSENVLIISDKGKAPIANAVKDVKKLSMADEIFGTKTAAAKGSNASGKSGFWQGTDGHKYYVKEYADPTQARGEHLANKIYERLGLSTPTSFTVEHEGKLYYASRIVDDVSSFGSMKSADGAKRILDGFAADVLLANWDVAGLSLDNVMVGPNGLIYRIDNGSALLHRAQGTRKASHFLNNATEWDGFANPNVNKEYAGIFKLAGIEEAHQIEGIKEQIEKIIALKAEVGGWQKFVDEIVPDMNAADKSAVVKMLDARTAFLQSKLDELTKAQQAHTVAVAKKVHERIQDEVTQSSVLVPADVLSAKEDVDKHLFKLENLVAEITDNNEPPVLHTQIMKHIQYAENATDAINTVKVTHAEFSGKAKKSNVLHAFLNDIDVQISDVEEMIEQLTDVISSSKHAEVQLTSSKLKDALYAHLDVLFLDQKAAQEAQKLLKKPTVAIKSITDLELELKQKQQALKSVVSSQDDPLFIDKLVVHKKAVEEAERALAAAKAHESLKLKRPIQSNLENQALQSITKESPDLQVFALEVPELAFVSSDALNTSLDSWYAKEAMLQHLLSSGSLNASKELAQAHLRYVQTAQAYKSYYDLVTSGQHVDPKLYSGLTADLAGYAVKMKALKLEGLKKLPAAAVASIQPPPPPPPKHLFSSNLVYSQVHVENYKSKGYKVAYFVESEDSVIETLKQGKLVHAHTASGAYLNEGNVKKLVTNSPDLKAIPVLYNAASVYQIAESAVKPLLKKHGVLDFKDLFDLPVFYQYDGLKIIRNDGTSLIYLHAAEKGLPVLDSHAVKVGASLNFNVPTDFQAMPSIRDGGPVTPLTLLKEKMDKLEKELDVAISKAPDGTTAGEMKKQVLYAKKYEVNAVGNLEATKIKLAELQAKPGYSAGEALDLQEKIAGYEQKLRIAADNVRMLEVVYETHTTFDTSKLSKKAAELKLAQHQGVVDDILSKHQDPFSSYHTGLVDTTPLSLKLEYGKSLAMVQKLEAHLKDIEIKKHQAMLAKKTATPETKLVFEAELLAKKDELSEKLKKVYSAGLVNVTPEQAAALQSQQNLLYEKLQEVEKLYFSAFKVEMVNTTEYVAHQVSSFDEYKSKLDKLIAMQSATENVKTTKSTQAYLAKKIEEFKDPEIVDPLKKDYAKKKVNKLLDNKLVELDQAAQSHKAAKTSYENFGGAAASHEGTVLGLTDDMLKHKVSMLAQEAQVLSLKKKLIDVVVPSERESLLRQIKEHQVNSIKSYSSMMAAQESLFLAEVDKIAYVDSGPLLTPTQQFKKLGYEARIKAAQLHQEISKVKLEYAAATDADVKKALIAKVDALEKLAAEHDAAGIRYLQKVPSKHHYEKAIEEAKKELEVLVKRNAHHRDILEVQKHVEELEKHLHGYIAPLKPEDFAKEVDVKEVMKIVQMHQEYLSTKSPTAAAHLVDYARNRFRAIPNSAKRHFTVEKYHEIIAHETARFEAELRLHGNSAAEIEKQKRDWLTPKKAGMSYQGGPGKVRKLTQAMSLGVDLDLLTVDRNILKDAAAKVQAAHFHHAMLTTRVQHAELYRAPAGNWHKDEPFEAAKNVGDRVITSGASFSKMNYAKGESASGFDASEGTIYRVVNPGYGYDHLAHGSQAYLGEAEVTLAGEFMLQSIETIYVPRHGETTMKTFVRVH